MIRLICGPKGTGKTKIILDEVKKSVETAKGDIVFITDTKKDFTRGIDFNVRVLYTDEFSVNNPVAFTGFVKGLMAGNSDIQYLFIDGLARIIGDDMKDVEAFVKTLEQLEREYSLSTVATISKLQEEFSDNYKRYAE